MKVDLDLEAFYLEDDLEVEFVELDKPQSDPFEEIKRQCRELSRDMETWRADAACVGKYQWKTDTKEKITEKTFINSVCSKCSFKEQCLLVAICYRDEHLVWGGTTPNERAKLIKEIQTKEDNPNLFKFWRKEYLDVVRQYISNFYAAQAKVASSTP